MRIFTKQIIRRFPHSNDLLAEHLDQWNVLILGLVAKYITDMWNNLKKPFFVMAPMADVLGKRRLLKIITSNCVVEGRKPILRMRSLQIGSNIQTATGQGLEPRFLGPKPSVLPLDDPAILNA